MRRHAAVLLLTVLLVAPFAPLAAVAADHPVQAALASGDVDRAVRVGEGRTKGGGSATDWMWLGHAYAQQVMQVGLLRRAVVATRLRDAYLEALERDPDLHEARMMLVEYYLAAPAIVGGSEAEARRQVVDLGKRDAGWGAYGKARLAMQEGDEATAKRAYLAASRADPANARFRLAAGIALANTGEHDKAMAHFRAWTRDAPREADAWYQLGRTAYLTTGYEVEGIAAFDRVLALDLPASSILPKYAWLRRGQLLARSGDKAGAQASFRRALALDPDLEDARKALAAR